MDLLTVSGVTKRKEKDFILNEVSFKLNGLQKIALAGETGSGKSTLLKIIAGVLQRDGGEVLFDGQMVLGPEEKLLPGHQGIAYLSQHFELRNNYRVEEILEMANKMADEEAATIFEVCRISHLLKRRTDQLSGDEKQRIATARLLITKPKLLLLDEPYSNLDLIHKNILRSVINDISERLKITCILTSHDPTDTLPWADEMLIMKEGQIVQHGTPKQLYNQPLNEHVAGLLGSYNLFTPSEALLLKVFSLIDAKDKNTIIRPENFVIVKYNSQAIKGTVKKVNFFGSYYVIEVIVFKKIITVKSILCEVEEGQTVYLKLYSNDVAYVN